MLREPVRRVLSLYYFVKANWPTSDAAQKSLREFVIDGALPYRQNDQTRRLSGLATDADGKLPSAAIDVARRHMNRDFAAVGTTERFDETMVLMQQRLSWSRPPFYIRSNSNHSRPGLEDIESSTIELIREQNAMDLELYEAAEKKLDDLIAAIGPGFHEAVARFRSMNSACQTVAGPPLRLFRLARSTVHKLSSS